MKDSPRGRSFRTWKLSQMNSLCRPDKSELRTTDLFCEYYDFGIKVEHVEGEYEWFWYEVGGDVMNPLAIQDWLNEFILSSEDYDKCIEARWWYIYHTYPAPLKYETMTKTVYVFPLIVLCLYVLLNIINSCLSLWYYVVVVFGAEAKWSLHKPSICFLGHPISDID